ncbi:hypothetical protein HK104_006001 [Borealophlyctis nickersoniae]|nr:hypothetical protein HK104_006001 [Borealophlyctis nickersoniae]
MVSYTALPLFSTTTGESHTPAQYTRKRKLHSCLCFLIAIVVFAGLFLFGGREIECVSNPIYVKGRPVERVIHQSWKTSKVPDVGASANAFMDAAQVGPYTPFINATRTFIILNPYSKCPQIFQDWAESWRRFHPDWEYILWTDTTNRQLIETHYPWFLSYYDRLPSNIARADTSRYFYMHKFGGMYADLDAECVRNFEDLLTPHNGTAFIAAMSTDYAHDHNIPNAWLASGKEHPFWLHVIYQIMGEVEKGTTDAEKITGPVALKRAWQAYTRRVPAREREKVTVLEPGYIYPFDWHRADPSGADTGTCWGGEPNRHVFNPATCKKELKAEGKPGQKAYMITYWTHSWSDKDNKTVVEEGEVRSEDAGTVTEGVKAEVKAKLEGKKQKHKSHGVKKEEETSKEKAGGETAAAATIPAQAQPSETGKLADPDI